MDRQGILLSVATSVVGFLVNEWRWRYRRSIERADAAVDSGRDLLRQALLPVCDSLGRFVAAHRNEAAAGVPCIGNRRMLVADLRAILDDPVIPWPDGARRRTEELATQYAQSGDNDAQAAADAAEALRRYLASLLH